MADLIKNKKAGLDYFFLDHYEAGVELLGTEVKSIKNHQGSLLGARVVIRGGEAYLLGANIPPFQPANAPLDYDPERTRRLLLTEKQLGTLVGLEAKPGLTLIPISLHNKGKLIKLKFAVAKGKKKVDKREDLKKREAKREIERSLKNKYR